MLMTNVATEKPLLIMANVATEIIVLDTTVLVTSYLLCCFLLIF